MKKCRFIRCWSNPSLLTLIQIKLLLFLINIDNSIRFHDFRIVKGTTHINVLFDIVVPPKYKMSDNEIKYIISKEVKLKCEEKMNTTVNVVLTVDRDYVI